MKEELVVRDEVSDALRRIDLLPGDIEEIAFRDLLTAKAQEIATLFPIDMNLQRFIKSTMMAVSRNPDLMKCSRKSLFLATVDAAETGLDFTPAKGYACIVPYKNRDLEIWEAKFMPMYRGLIELATRTGRVHHVESHLVYHNDTFLYEYGTSPKIDHRPDVLHGRGEMIGAYAIAFYPDGFQQFHYMSIAELNRIRKFAKTDKVWAPHPEEMYRKCPVRNLFKYLPLSSPELSLAMERDNDLFDHGTGDQDEPKPEGDRVNNIEAQIDADSKIQEAELEPGTGKDADGLFPSNIV